MVELLEQALCQANSRIFPRTCPQKNGNEFGITQGRKTLEYEFFPWPIFLGQAPDRLKIGIVSHDKVDLKKNRVKPRNFELQNCFDIKNKASKQDNQDPPSC